MRFLFPLLVLVCFLPALGRAESRSIAVEIHQAKGMAVQVSMYSDVKAEQQRKISVAKAAEILKEAEGWGSSVEVAIVTDGQVDLSVYLPVLQAIADNAWLDLALLKPRGTLGEQILRHYKIERVDR